MPRGARSNYERTRSVPQHPDMAPAKRLRLLGRRATNVQARPPLLIAAQTSRRAALRALHLMGKQRQRPRTPVLCKVKGAAGAITTAAGAWANSRKRRWARPHLTSQRRRYWMQAIARVPCCFPAGLAPASAEGNGSEHDGRDTRLPVVTPFQRGVGTGDGLRRAPQDRPGTPALAGLAFAAFRPGTDTARE